MNRSFRLVLALLGQLLLASTVHAQSVFLSELADPRLDYLTDRFVEIYNPGPAPVDLTGWQIVAVGNGAEIFTWNLSGTIQPGDALVAGDATTVVAFDVDFAAEGWSGSNATWNGKVGDGARLKNASAVVVDEVVAPGTLFENRDLVRVPSVIAPSSSYVAAEWTSGSIDFPTQGTPGTHDANVSLTTISSIQVTPAAPGPADPVTVSAAVTDGGATITSVDLRWGTSPGVLDTTIPMSPGGGDIWSTSSPIPALTGGTIVYFEIEATNDVPSSTTSSVQNYSVVDDVTIADIQGQSASSPYVGATLRTTGVVTAVFGSAFVVQDGIGPWSGLWVDGAAPGLGDEITVQGLVTEDPDGTTRLTGAEILTTAPGSLPVPAVVSGAVGFDEAYEGVLVQVLDASCTAVDLGDGSWGVDDGTGAGEVGETGYPFEPTLGSRYDLRGPVRQAATAFRVEPRSAADVAFAGDDFAPVLVSVEALDLDVVRVTFTEALDALSAENAANYSLTSTTVTAAELVVSDPARVDLTTTGLPTGSATLTVDGVEDLFGNAVVAASLVFVVDDYGPPVGYYSSAAGLNGETLRGALHEIIDGHTQVSYSNTLNAFLTTDVKSNGKVWDMYSDTPGSTPPYEYTFGVDAGSSASGEGQGYNREHSWPRSWFGGTVAPMNSDLFQLYPTDIYVNSIRGSFPYGEVDVPDYLSANGSKRGPNTYPGYVGTVLEPIDAFKGDFARSYFYMVVRYYTEDAGWPGSGMTDGADLLPWAESMLYEWHVADPVSTKERARNQAIFGFQGNRNPFIDHPEYAAAMFQISTDVPRETVASLRVSPSAPNPFSSSTVIAFDLGRSADVDVAIYDVRGREVRRLTTGVLEAGSHRIPWNGRDGEGKPVAAGTYFYRVRADGAMQSRSMVLLR